MDWMQDGGFSWSLIHQQTYLVNRLENNRYNPIPDIFITSDKLKFIVGINCPKAYVEWQLGAWLSVQAQFSSINSNFGNWIDIYKEYLSIKKLTLIEVIQTSSPPYRLHLKIPHWHEEIYLEIWEISS